MAAYQEAQPLTIGELWAVAITLRIVLVENLRRLAERIVFSRIGRQEADTLADRLLAAGGPGRESVSDVLAGHARPALPDAFAVQLIHRLRDQNSSIAPALAWLDERLAAQGMTTDAVVRNEHQRQGAANVTVRNIITSMRLISDVDWTELFERICLVDEALAVGNGFREMDFATRNLYRSAIEDLARGAGRREIEVAREAAAAARSAVSAETDAETPRRSDPGYYLFAGGRRAFEISIGYRPPLGTWLGRFNQAVGIAGYLNAIGFVAVMLLIFPLSTAADSGIRDGWVALLCLLGSIPAIDAAVALVNRGVARGFGATLLPGLALRGGVPSRLRTLVAVPTMLTTRASIEAQVERLEIHHLASPEGDLHFALLSEWQDADAEHAGRR